jgi:hypothetical protein
MRKQTNVELTKEEDGIKAQIDILGETLTATVSFESIPFYPFILDEDGLKKIKTEVTTLLSKINQIKKDERRKAKSAKRNSKK